MYRAVVGSSLSIPHFRILGRRWEREGAQNCFQFLILGYKGVSFSPYNYRVLFQFLILGYRGDQSGKERRPDEPFQFLILGYRYKRLHLLYRR